MFFALYRRGSHLVGIAFWPYMKYHIIFKTGTVDKMVAVPGCLIGKKGFFLLRDRSDKIERKCSCHADVL